MAAVASTTMKWTKNNRACVATWVTLLILDQITKTFKATEKVKIGKLSMWNSTDTKAMRSKRARSLSTMIDNIFKDKERTKYESGKSSSSAQAAVTAVLIDDDMTVAELADVIDDQYQFPSEVANA